MTDALLDPIRASGAKPRVLRVLHVVPSFYPAVAFGGPIHSTKAICDAAARAPDIWLRVLTTDAAGPDDSAPLALQRNPSIFPGGYEVRYCRRVAGASISPELLARLPAAVHWADIVHLTGPYSFPTLPTLALCRLLGRPVVWSPRGGLQATAEWADAPRRRAKMAFERLCDLLRPRQTVLHVTSAAEAESSRCRLPGLPCALIPNGVQIPPPFKRCWRPCGRLRLMFLSRVHPKKGLDLLIDAMTTLPAHVSLDVYGAGAPAYLAELRERTRRRRLSDRVSFHGHVDGARKSRAFAGADIFVLPTRSENFGIAIAEALAHGLPVITTKAAPWSGLEAHQCGLWTEPNTAAVAAAIRSLEPADLAAMGARGRAWMHRDFAPDAVSAQMIRLYRRMADNAQKAIA